MGMSLASLEVDHAVPWSKIMDALRRIESATSLSAIADAVTRSARELMACDGATFVAREADECHYVSEDAIGPLWRGLRFPMSMCLSGWVMQNVATATVPDIFLDPRIPYTVYEPTFARSVILVPVGSEPMAALGFYWKTTRAFDDRELRTAEMLAATVAPAVAHRYAQKTSERETERRHLMHEALHLGSWELDFGSCELSGSAVFKSHFGCQIDAALSYRDMLLSIALADSARLQRGLRNVVNDGKPLDMVATVRGLDGHDRKVQLVASMETSLRGSSERIWGVSRLL
jgi:GAF domain-containing protein